MKICIPCFNKLSQDHRFIVHKHSHAKCNECGKKRQGLKVSYDDNYICNHPDGCDHSKIVWICGLDLRDCPKEEPCEIG